MENNLPAVKNNKLDLIQAFRGFAAFLVVMAHLTEFSYEKFNQNFILELARFGYSGVDFFFVLSGFIIFYAHRHDLAKPQKFKTFIEKRFVRIFPVYWLVTLALAIVYFFVPSFGHQIHIGYLLTSLILYPQEQPPIVTAGWTLRHELLFYLMFGLAILLKPKFSKAIIGTWLTASLGLFIVKLTGNFYGRGIPYAIDFLFSELNLEFALGFLATYLLFEINKRLTVKFKFFIFYGGIVVFLLSGIFFYGNLLIRIITFGIPSFLIILGAALLELDNLINVPGILSYIGTASYSIYLTHASFISVIGRVALVLHLDKFIGKFLTTGAIGLAAIGAGCIFYSFVENPLTEFARNKVLQNPKNKQARL